MEKSDAQAMLASTQQLRTHWSGVITSHLGLSLTINVAIWSYFIAAYVDSGSGSDENPVFILVPSALSAVLLGLWRLYTRHIDDHLANLYPDLLLCEGVLCVPIERGTSGYLAKAVPNTKALLTSAELSIEKRIKGVEELAAKKKIGDRGHKRIDLFALLVIAGISFLSILVIADSGEKSHIYFLLGNAFGIYFLVMALTRFQQNPEICFIKNIVNKISVQHAGGNKET